MNQNYKFRSLQLAEAAEERAQQEQEFTVFERDETRTIDFELLDGTRQNFSYAHYLTAWLGKEGEERIIKVVFATHSITIHGTRLDSLYNGIIALLVKSVKAQDERYASMVEDIEPFVTDIKISWRKETTSENA